MKLSTDRWTALECVEHLTIAEEVLLGRLKNGEPLAQPWPRYERVLTRDERLELQQQLANHGFDVGTPDGQLGGRTRAALRQFQAQMGFVPDGFATAAVLERLRQ